MKKINILKIIPLHTNGGAERIAIELAKRINKHRFNVSFCGLFYGNKLKKELIPLLKELKQQNIKIFLLKKKLGIDFFIIPKIIKILKKEKIEIIHTHLLTADTWGRIAAKIAKVPFLITTKHSVDWWKNQIYIVPDKILEKFTDKIIAVSNEVKSFYINHGNIPSKKIITIHNCVDVNKFNLTININKKKKELKLNPNDLITGIIASLKKTKNNKNFLNAARLVIKQIPNTKFLIIGDGPLRKELEDYSKSIGLSKNVIFTGLREDVPELLNVIDISILSSDYEGLPLAILEAMAASKPVVATKVGGVQEAVVDGKTGILVLPKNPEALANAIIKLLKNQKLRKKMGKAGRARVEKYFTIERMVKEYEKVYDEMTRKF